MKVIVAHPGLQHSLKTSEGLYNKGILFKFITTVYCKENKCFNLLKKLLPSTISKKLTKRKSNILPDDKVMMFNTFLGFLLLYIYKLPINHNLINNLFKYVEDKFGSNVAHYAIKNNVDAVIMYDTTTNACFKILKEKAPNIIRIQDVSIANRLFMKHNYILDMNKTHDSTLMQEQKHLWNPQNITRYAEELELSQYFIVASNMSKRSLKFSNVDEEKIYVIPYGVEQNRFKQIPKKFKPDEPLKLIYVGQISYRKGLHHLLKVISEMYNASDVNLNLIGYYSTDNKLYKKYKNYPNIHFLGFVGHEELYKYYNNADVFVFPTLGEGYGLVILEALSCGLPVICSNLAGGDDAITNGYNGFVFEAGNDIDLADKINWFIKNRNKIQEISFNCKKSSLIYTWDNYYKNVSETICTIINTNNRQKS